MTRPVVRVPVSVDPRRCVPLWDVGADYEAGVAVIDGSDYANTEVLVLLDRDARVVTDMLCARVTHEQLGPLPELWRQRVAAAPLRCGRITRAGSRCRAQVGAAGQPCRHHRDAEQLMLPHSQDVRR